jgi:glycosyltransferase involved in cell wall biosynthesis
VPKDTHPSVSVVIPTHDRPESLSRAIESALEQTVQPLEVIIVDDLGLPSTEDAVLRFAGGANVVRYIDAAASTVKGPGASRNAGAALTTGEMIAFLDDDDEWLTSYLEEALAARSATEPLDVVITWAYRIRDGVRYPGARLQTDVDYRSGAKYWGFGVSGSNTLISRRMFDEISGFDETLWALEDWDLFTRAMEAGASYGVVSNENVQQSADGAGHLAAKSLRAARAARLYLAKHGHNMSRSQIRGARRYYHAMSRTRENPRLVRLWHSLQQLRLSSATEFKAMSIGRISRTRPAPLN